MRTDTSTDTSTGAVEVSIKNGVLRFCEQKDQFAFVKRCHCAGLTRLRIWEVAACASMAAGLIPGQNYSILKAAQRTYF